MSERLSCDNIMDKLVVLSMVELFIYGNIVIIYLILHLFGVV